MSAQDGGPAFPRADGVWIPEERGLTSEAQDGMSLRDFIAAQVVSGLGGTHTHYHGVASQAYRIADAMLSVREGAGSEDMSWHDKANMLRAELEKCRNVLGSVLGTLQKRDEDGNPRIPSWEPIEYRLGAIDEIMARLAGTEGDDEPSEAEGGAS